MNSRENSDALTGSAVIQGPWVDDPVGQAIASLTSSASALADLALLSANRDRMANEQDFEIICHALTQIQFVASLVDVRMVANGQIETEDAL
jgi:hypothetical protein